MKKFLAFAIFCLLFILTLVAKSAPSLQSLSLQMTSNGVSSFLLQAEVLYSSMPETTKPLAAGIHSIAIRDYSGIIEWSNAVNSMVCGGIFKNSSAKREVWHLQLVKSGENLRYDTLEDFFGNYTNGGTFLSPTVSRISVGNPSVTSYVNYIVDQQNRSIRISGAQNFFKIIPVEDLVEMPGTIKMVFSLMNQTSKGLIYDSKPMGNDLVAYEALLENEPNSKTPFLKALYNKTKSTWVGVFVFDTKSGTITSAAMSSGGLGGAITSPTLYIDKIAPPGGRGDPRDLVTLINPSAFLTSNIQESAFNLEIPTNSTNWLILDERSGKATRGGKIVGIIKEHEDKTDLIKKIILKNDLGSIRVAILTVFFLPLLIMLIVFVKKRFSK